MRVKSLQDGGDGGGADGETDKAAGGGGLRNDAGEATIPQDLLQKYIQYARTHMRPSLHGKPWRRHFMVARTRTTPLQAPSPFSPKFTQPNPDSFHILRKKTYF